jgi:hypothetical protein
MEVTLETLIAYLPALACAVAMVVCFRMMSSHNGQPQDAKANEELLEFREKVARLEAEPTDVRLEETRHG